MSEMFNDPNLAAFREQLFTNLDLPVPVNYEDTAAPGYFTQTPVSQQQPSRPAIGTGSAIPNYTPPAAAFSAQEILENALYDAVGIRGLGTWAAGLYNRGASTNEIVASLRYGSDKSEAGQAARAAYLQAFPKMDKFLEQGVFAGSNPELQYISYRNTVNEAASRYNINPSLTSADRIADLIEKRVSAAEVTDRMGLAAQAVATTPPETLSILRDYYGVQNGDLVSFYLDPDQTEANLAKRYTAARIGTEAMYQNIGVDAALAENLATQGVSVDQARTGFSTVAASQGLTQGRGDVVSQEQLISGTLTDNQEAKQAINRAAGARVGRFQGGGEFVRNEGRVAGLGSAATR